MNMEELQKRIDALQSRQLALRAIMASSDERAAKCNKTGASFRETYPQDFAEYNRNELTLAELEAERKEEMRIQSKIG